MPPRFVYWTIIAGGLPTSFRAADRDELLPTFRRIKEKHPDAEMKYFARGKLWSSAEEARAASRADRTSAPAGGSPGERERRGRDWRPGGAHRDPRQPFKDAKKARNQDRRQDRWERKNQTREPARRDADRAPRERPHGDPLAPRGERRAAPKRPFRKPEKPRTAAPRGKWTDNAPRGKWTDKAPRTKPHGDKFRDEGPRRDFKPSGRRFERNQQTPPRPPGPNREPKPGREPKPEPPPRPSEPQTLPPGPPERGSEPPARPARKRRPEE